MMDEFCIIEDDAEPVEEEPKPPAFPAEAAVSVAKPEPKKEIPPAIVVPDVQAAGPVDPILVKAATRSPAPRRAALDVAVVPAQNPEEEEQYLLPFLVRLNSIVCSWIS